MNQSYSKIWALVFNMVRMSVVFLILAGVSALTGNWRKFTGTTIQTLMISGLISIFLGYTAFFDSLECLDSSRSAVVFSINALMIDFPEWQWGYGSCSQTFRTYSCDDSAPS